MPIRNIDTKILKETLSIECIMYKTIIHHYQERLTPGCKVVSTLKKNQCNPSYQEYKEEKNPLIKLTDEEKASDKTQYPFTINSLRKLEIEGKVLNLIKNSYKNCTENIIVCDEKIEFSY